MHHPIKTGGSPPDCSVRYYNLSSLQQSSSIIAFHFLRSLG